MSNRGGRGKGHDYYNFDSSSLEAAANACKYLDSSDNA